MVMYVTEKVLCQKIDKYYFKNPSGAIRKYSQFCRRKNCKTESSYNYENLKPRYCNKHKKPDMVNVKRGHKLCKHVNYLIKQNVLQNSVNILLKNIQHNQLI